MKVEMQKRAMRRVLTRDYMLVANGSPSIGSRGFKPNYWSKENLIIGADRITGAMQIAAWSCDHNRSMSVDADTRHV